MSERPCPASNARAVAAFRRVAATLGSAIVLAAVPAAVPAAGALAAAAQSAAPGTVHVYAVGSATSPTQSVVLTGAIGDAGTLSVTGPTDTVTLSKGTIVLDLSKGSAAENKLFNHLSAVVNPKSCSMNSSYTAPVKVLGGSGAYAGATGTLVVRTAEVGVFPRTASGTCNLGANAQPVGFLSIAKGSGVVRLK